MEVIVALGILVTGIISGLTLTTFNLNVSAAGEGRLMAANFAREGLEVIRQKRDSNWLAGDDWHTGILEDPQNNYRLTVNFDPTDNSWSTADQTVDIAGCSDCQLYYNAGNGVFSHNDGGELTSFKRLITIQEICWSELSEEEAVLDNNEHCQSFGLGLIGWQLTSQITWHDNNQDHDLKIIDRIYDWK